MKDVLKGLRIGTGVVLAVAAAWAMAAFAAAAWGALPNATAGTQVSATAWNDVVSQLNALAGAMNVSSGNVGIGIAPSTKLDVNGDVLIR